MIGVPSTENVAKTLEISTIFCIGVSTSDSLVVCQDNPSPRVELRGYKGMAYSAYIFFTIGLDYRCVVVSRSDWNSSCT